MEDLFDDPGDLGFFDLDDEVNVPTEEHNFESPLPGESDERPEWARDVRVIEHPDGSASFRGKLIGLGF